jgi:putative ABC transport system permease protein
LGLIGIATHAMAQRSFEIGVRRTLGASARQVLAMLLRDFGKPILIANLLAWPLAYVIAKAYTSLFADRVAITISPFVTSLLLGLAIAWLAVLKQAIGAARMNPATVLRHE